MRMLVRVFGITTYATSTVVAVFMGGLALGAWLSGRWLARNRPSLRTYGLIEIGVGSSAAPATAAMHVLPDVYAALYPGVPPVMGESNPVELPLRFALAAVVLVVPTTLMGATLPVIARWITRGAGEIGDRLGLYYGLNTLGAVFGVLSAGFFLMALLGEFGSVGVGVVLNLAVGAACFAWPDGARRADPAPEASAEDGPSLTPWLVLASISGACAIGYEILLTRMLILVVGNSVYAFSSMLASYLGGIALGSLAVRRWADKLPSPAVAFGLLQLGVAVLGASACRCSGASARSPPTAATSTPR